MEDRMRIMSYICFTIVLASVALLSSCTTLPGSTNLIGRPKAEAVKQLGKPASIAGPESGYQTYEYPERGLSVVFQDGKVVQTVLNGSSEKTTLGVGIGTPMPQVTKVYGNYKREEEVKKWFGGNVPHVLYHHKEFNKYKINYPEQDLIFMFDGDKKVERITVGYIFPIEND
jgi:hypothetical protein